MRTKSFRDMTCSIAGAVEDIGDKWAVLVMRDLTLGLTKFEQFERSLGISTNTLSTRLRQLEQNGLVRREPYQERPVRHAYRLTEKGRDFWLVLAALLQWGDRWNASGAGAPPVILADEAGHPMELRLMPKSAPEAAVVRRVLPGPGADETVRWRLAQRNAAPGDDAA